MSMRIISWEEYTAPESLPDTPLAVTVGVFDGVHRGHQSLIQRICAAPPPDPHSPPTAPYLPTVITFRQNPQQILKPDAFAGDIMNLEQKLRAFEVLGVQLAVLIDFSEKFSKINGRVFIDLLLNRPVRMIALGRNFRCGYRLDTGAEEIRSLAGAHGTEVWVAPPVMDEGQPVSSSRIRQALAAGRQAEAERLLGWPQKFE
jgi:riboflavin kinase/FMN adenylyltransferase